MDAGVSTTIVRPDKPARLGGWPHRRDGDRDNEHLKANGKIVGDSR